MVKAINTEVQSLDTYSQNLPTYMDATHVTPLKQYIYTCRDVHPTPAVYRYRCRDVNPTPASNTCIHAGMSIQLLQDIDIYIIYIIYIYIYISKESSHMYTCRDVNPTPASNSMLLLLLLTAVTTGTTYCIILGDSGRCSALYDHATSLELHTAFKADGLSNSNTPWVLETCKLPHCLKSLLIMHEWRTYAFPNAVDLKLDDVAITRVTDSPIEHGSLHDV